MKISILRLGTLKVNAFEMIMGVSEETIRKQYEVNSENEMRIGMNALIVETGERLILFDPGTATFLSKTLAETYDMEMEYSLEETVSRAGYAMDQVTDVLFTHLHFDHGSGAFLRVIGGIVKAFPNARYVVCRKQLEYILTLPAEESSSFFHKLLRYAGELTYFEDWQAEGFSFYTSHGHTAHMQVPIIDAGDHDVLFATDLFPMELHGLKGAWSYYDENKELLESERTQLGALLRPGSQIVYYHETDLGGK